MATQAAWQLRQRRALVSLVRVPHRFVLYASFSARLLRLHLVPVAFAFTGTPKGASTPGERRATGVEGGEAFAKGFAGEGAATIGPLRRCGAILEDLRATVLQCFPNRTQEQIPL